MSTPKRHHWWPQLQSRHWIGPHGHIYVTAQDGRSFKTSTSNIGVESDLYTRFINHDQKDTSVEEWFSQEIEGPFARIFDELVALHGLRRERFAGDPRKASTIEALGFQVEDHREFVVLRPAVRAALANYVAALLVRHPNYLRKLEKFHQSENEASGEATKRELSLANMAHVYDIYRHAINEATISFVRSIGSHEFLFSDGGISAAEPWRQNPIPFDVHFPLTPSMAAEIVPWPGDPAPERVYAMGARNKAMARFNRIALADASRFVFSRCEPPVPFIVKYFGRPAPSAFGHRFVQGQLETKYDASRDK